MMGGGCQRHCVGDWDDGRYREKQQTLEKLRLSHKSTESLTKKARDLRHGMTGGKSEQRIDKAKKQRSWVDTAPYAPGIMFYKSKMTKYY